jgi:hypothetical protein
MFDRRFRYLLLVAGMHLLLTKELIADLEPIRSVTPKSNVIYLNLKVYRNLTNN